MGRFRPWNRAAAALTAAAAVAVTSTLVAVPAAASTSTICTSSAHPVLAARMSRDIAASHRGRSSVTAFHIDVPSRNLVCSWHASWHFYSASIVKVTILAALLRKAQEKGRSLTDAERARAWRMITYSDNSSATWLWNDVGRWWLQHFLNLAHMSHTILGPDGYWGLTRVTAYDESLQLRLLVRKNSVLTSANRWYELYLMAHVVASQRWGTPVGVPSSYTVHVKNGWLPVSGYGWFINSLGAFTKTGGTYTMDVLTDHNPTMSYGVTTVEKIAYAANHDLNPTATATVPPSAPYPSWGQPDESIPSSGRP